MNKLSPKRIFTTLLGYIFLFTLFLCFNRPINNLLKTILVNPFLAEFHSNRVTNGLVTIVSGLTVVWLWINLDRRPLLGLGITTILFYVTERTSGYWHFQPFLFWQHFYLCDILALAFIIPALKFLIPRSSGTPRPDRGQGFDEDIPIGTPEEDLFNRTEVANEIAQTILLTSNRQAFAIGILGDYGSGKTSFIRLIEKFLDERKSEVIHFNPWNAENTSNIQKGFFDLLAKRLYEINPQLPGLVLNYSRKLSRLDTSTEKFIRQIGFIQSIFQFNNYTDDYDQINELLKGSAKKIIVAIDDLDRLYSNEVMEVLRLIRNTASFGNIIYLVAYERGYVQKSIKTMNPHAEQTYLDKIIQLEIPLPKREKDDLINLLKTRLTPILTPADQSALKEHVIKNGFMNKFDFAYPTVFRTARDIIKFTNTFKISYKLLGNEVLFDNLFVLELLKFRFPLVYDMLFDHTEKVLFTSPTTSTYREFYKLRTFKEGDNDQLLISKTLLEQGYSTDDIALICSLFRNLFSSFSRAGESKNSIIYPMFMERYFRYRVSSRELSETSFRTAFNTGLSDLKVFIDQCVERQLHTQLGTRLYQVNPPNLQSFEIKIAGIFYLGPHYVALRGITSPDYGNLLHMIRDDQHQVTKRYYSQVEGRYRSFIKNLFEQAPFPYLFHNQLIYESKDETQDLPLAKNELTALQVHYFCEHVQKAGITKEAIWLMWGIRENFKIPGDEPNTHYKNWRFEPSLVPHIKNFLIVGNPVNFLKTSINREMRDDRISSIHQQILDIFDKPEDLRNLVETHSSLAEDVRTEYLEFFDLCADDNFKRFVEYDFKTELNPEISNGH